MSDRLPTVTSPIPRDLRVYLDRLRDILAAQGEAKFVTMGDLARIASSGSSSGSGSSGAGGGGGGLPAVPPPAPIGLLATPAFRSVILTWDAPAYSGHAYAEVWAASTNVLGSAVLVGMAPGAIYVDGVGSGTTKYYWVRFVNTSDLRGPYNAVAGTVATTATDIAYTLDLLTGQLTDLQLHADLAARIDLIDGPVSTPGTLPNKLAALQGQINALNSTPAYDNSTTYSVGNMVTYGGKLYVAEATTTGNLPTDDTYWLELGDYSALADAVALHASQISTLTTDLAAETSARTLLAATVASNTAAISSEASTRASADTAIATNVTTLFASVASNLAAINSEAVARANADSALSSQIDTITASAAGKNKVYRQTTAPTNTPPGTLLTGDLWFDSDDGNKTYRWSGTAWVDTSDTRMATNAAAIVSEATARADADSALATQISTLEADIDAVSAAVQTEALARADGDAAGATSLASAITTVQARINANVGVSTRLYWGFDTSVEGWTAGNATVTASNGRITWTPTAANGALTRVLAGGDQYLGSTAPVVRARVRRISGTGVWEGRVYYSTASHTYTSTYTKQIAQPEDVSAWNELEWDMAALTAGGNDYVSNTITGLRLDLVSDATSSWEIDWIGAGEATVTPTMVSIRQESTVRAQQTGELYASYTVKIDNNGYVSGFGMASTTNTGTPSSTFAIRADSFYIASPEGPGVVPTMPFIVRTTETPIGGEVVPAGVYMRDAYIQNGSITAAKIADLTVDDAKIANLSVSKLTAGSIAVGEYIQSTNYIPGTQGWKITGDGNTELSNALVRGEVIAPGVDGGYARMYGGNFEIYKNVPGVGVVQYKALSRIETGTGANNVQVTIPGYFSAQPKIIVSPANIQLYNATYAGQSQSLSCSADNIVETSPGSMVWRFTPVAQLALAASSGATVINQNSGTQTGAWTSSTYTTAAGTLNITPSVTLASYRGTGTSGQYYKRTVQWRVEYYNPGTALWVNGAWTTVALDASTSASTASSASFTFPSAGAWQFRIRCEASDTGGTFTTSTTYDYATGNASRTDTVSASAYSPDSGSSDYESIPNYAPPYTPPTGWTVYQISYTLSYRVYVSAGFGGAASASISLSGTAGVSKYVSDDSTDTGVKSITVTRNSSSNTITASMSASGNLFGAASASVYLYSAYATFSLRKPQTNSTTAANTFQFNSYGYALSSATVLATGTLNWIAVGD